MRTLERNTARVVLPKVLIEDGLERETFPTHVAVEGLVACMFADMVLQLILAGILLPTHPTHKWSDSHVEPHVPI